MLAEQWISELFLQDIVQVDSINGGDINEAHFVKTNNEQGYFVKSNVYPNGNSMLKTEALGLKLLNDKSKFKIPKVLKVGSTSGRHYLILDYIIPGDENETSWEDFASNLVDLHTQSNTHFGLDHNNYIGPLGQSNNYSNTWADFFILERILPLFKIGIDSGLFNKKLFRLEARLHSFLSAMPVEAPSLLHGDLWAGNYMVNQFGEIVLIDPAVYFGHREMDLAMMQLFGGFPQMVFDVYNEKLPLQNKFEDRIKLFQLYPLLVHAILFQGSYVNRVLSILNGY